MEVVGHLVVIALMSIIPETQEGLSGLDVTLTTPEAGAVLFGSVISELWKCMGVTIVIKLL